MSDPELPSGPYEEFLDCGEPASGPSEQDASRCHGDEADSCEELPLTDALLDRLRAAGF